MNVPVPESADEVLDEREQLIEPHEVLIDGRRHEHREIAHLQSLGPLAFVHDPDSLPEEAIIIQDSFAPGGLEMLD